MPVVSWAESPHALTPDTSKLVTIQNQVIDGAGPVALPLHFPPQPAYHWPTATLDNVCVQGNYDIGVQLRHAWNANLHNVTVVGALTNEFSKPIMAVGLDLGTSMDVHLSNIRVVHAHFGILLTDPDEQGHAEGFHLDGGWMQHVRIGVELRGSGSGGWPTPCARILNQHIAYNLFGVQVNRYTGVLVQGMNFYSEPHEVWTYGLVLRNCWHVSILGCHFWRNGDPRGSYGIFLDNCHHVVIDGCTATNTIATHVYVMKSCSNVQFGTNSFMPERIVWA